MHPAPIPPDLTRAILARTSGDPCRRLEQLACDFVDGELEAAQAQLAHLHLAHCPACTALVAALGTLQVTLPTLAQADPGPAFTQTVLRATRRAPAGWPALPSALPNPRPGAVWRRLMARPRIALEAAYLGAAAGLMGTYLPLPAPDLALKAPALVQPMLQPLGDSAQRMAARMEQVVAAERRTVQSLQQSLEPLLAPGLAPLRDGRRWQRVSTRIRTWLRDLRRTPPAQKPPPPPNPR